VQGREAHLTSSLRNELSGRPKVRMEDPGQHYDCLYARSAAMPGCLRADFGTLRHDAAYNEAVLLARASKIHLPVLAIGADVFRHNMADHMQFWVANNVSGRHRCQDLPGTDLPENPRSPLSWFQISSPSRLWLRQSDPVAVKAR